MLTFSGIFVTPRNANSPSLLDIAVHCGRIPRFAGGTKVWWSVLQHQIVCRGIAMQLDPGNTRLHLLATVHDAHEAVTSDTPTTWKTPRMRRQQARLDQRIYRMLGILPPSTTEAEIVHHIDRAALLAEAAYLGPPRFPVAGVNPRDALIVAVVQRQFPETHRPSCAAVQWYMREVRRDLERT